MAVALLAGLGIPPHHGVPCMGQVILRNHHYLNGLGLTSRRF